MDWVHCNNCFILPDSVKNFFLTSCGHIYCGQCEEKCARGKCKLCGNQCSTITLSSAMKPDVQIYFTDPDELLKKKLKEVHQVSEFQKNHRARLMAHQRKQLKKFMSVKEDFRKLLKNLKDLDSEKKRLFQENDALKKYIGLQQMPSPVESPIIAYKGNHNSKPSSANVNLVLSKFVDKLDNSNLRSGMPQRICVISPPINGKLGNTLGSPSPRSHTSNLNASATYSNESLHKKLSAYFQTPGSSPSNVNRHATFTTPQTPMTVSPADSFKSPTDQKARMLQFQKEARRKQVVHPFSPND